MLTKNSYLSFLNNSFKAKNIVFTVVSDVDGDVIKCRKAIGSNECGGVCDSFPGLVLNEVCLKIVKCSLLS